MYNVLAHKQLSAYHASWALRPFNPPKRLAAEVAAAAAASARPQTAPFTPYVPSGGTRARQDRGRTTAGSKSVDSTAGARRPFSACDAAEAEAAEGRVDQPDSSASSAASTAPPPPPCSLPPPRPRLALMPRESALHSLHAADDATAINVQAAASAAALASLAEPEVDVETLGEAAQAADQFQVACLLHDADGKERLEAVPETRVMFFTETVLDNVRDTLTASATLAKSGTVCPVKSALASQTGLAVRTRKAVSFSIIANLELDPPGRRRDTGVQVNLVGGEETLATDSPRAAEAAAEPQADSDPTPPGSPGPSLGGISWHDMVLTEKLLKTVPITRTVSPEPKKYIHEGRRWPLRSPRTVYKRVKGHNKLSVAYLLEAAASLNDSAEKTKALGVAFAANTNPLTLLTTHEEASKEDECNEASDASEGRSHGSQSFNKKETSTSTSEKIQSLPKTSDSIIMHKTESPSNFDTSHYTESMTCEISSKPSQDEKKSLTGEVGKCSKEPSQGPLGAVAEFVKSRVKKRHPSSPRKQDKKKFQQKERRSKLSRYQRFFPNRYHVDLALVMTLERSRKNLLPSIHGPWNSSKPDPQVKLSKRAIKMSKL